MASTMGLSTELFTEAVAVDGSSRDRATTAATLVSGTRSLASSSVTAYGNIERPGAIPVVVSDAGGLDGMQRNK